MPCVRSTHGVCFCLSDLRGVQRFKIPICLCSHDLYIPRWGAKHRIFLPLSLQTSSIFWWLDTPWCKYLCLTNNILLFLLGIGAIMDLWNEILRERHALLTDSSMHPIFQSQVHKVDRHLDLHTCHVGHAHLEFSYLAWLRQRRFTWLILVMGSKHLVKNHISFVADLNIC